MTPAEAHAIALRHLRANPELDTLYLVARLDAAPIGNADPRVHVFVPDLHLLSHASEARYQYSFNAEPMFDQMLAGLRAAKAELEAGGSGLAVVQLGDLYDLWREAATADTAGRILRDHLPLLNKLYLSRTGLGASIVVGNHDVDMRGRDGNFHTTRGIPLDGQNVGPFCGVALHGDMFDTFERTVPDAIKAWGVFLLAPLVGPQERPLVDAQGRKMAELRALHEAEAARTDNFRTFIQLPRGAPITGLVRVGDGVLPAEWNVRRKSARVPTHEYLDTAATLVRGVPATLGRVRLVVIGHTHWARLAVDDAVADDPVVLMDCGAWIETYVDPLTNRHGQNCQIGVVAGADLRLYQLDAKSAPR